jgi:sensor c-di-GMP phosphodiesterase-like protein
MVQPSGGSFRSIKSLIALNALAVALPILGLLAFGYVRTVDRIQNELTVVAQASVTHGDAVLGRVHSVLRTLVENGTTSCSEADRKIYQRRVYETIEIRGIGVLDANAKLFICTDLEILNPVSVVTDTNDLIIGAPGEIAIVAPKEDIQQQISIFVNYGHGNGKILDAAIYPNQFWNFQKSLGLGDGGAIYLLNKNGQALATLGETDSKLPSENGVRAAGFNRYGDTYAVSVRSTKYPIEAVSVASVKSVMKAWREAAMTFLPIALLCAGLGSYAIWRFAMRARPLSEMLHDALRNDELYVVYQPIMSLNTNRIAAVEVLCRWTHPERGDISPEVFVSDAARAGILPELSAWVFRRTATELGPLLQRDSDLRVSMNIGRDDLLADGPLSKAMLEHRNVLSRLIIEITERESLSEVMPEALKTITHWRDMGVKIALDDFGTGCCNLGYLRQLPIDIVKIDRMFASALDDSHNMADAEMFDAMRALLHARRLTVIAEGIERESQHHAVKERNIDMAQGWFYAKGMRINALEVWMVSHESQRKPLRFV